MTDSTGRRYPSIPVVLDLLEIMDDPWAARFLAALGFSKEEIPACWRQYLDTAPDEPAPALGLPAAPADPWVRFWQRPDGDRRRAASAPLPMIRAWWDDA